MLDDDAAAAAAAAAAFPLCHVSNAADVSALPAASPSRQFRAF